MGVKKIIKKIVFGLPQKYRIFAKYVGEWKNVLRKKDLYKNIDLTADEKKDIDMFYSQAYGRKISYRWHQLYQSYTGSYDKTYLPEILYSTKLEHRMNPYMYAAVLEDKNLLNVLFANVDGVRIPYTYCMCINGTFLDAHRNLINIDQLISLIHNIGNVVIKKSVSSNSGFGVMMCNFVEGIDLKSGNNILDIINGMGNDFKVEEKINQYHELSKIYSHSLNTFRVITYILNDKIFCAPLAMRMGRGGSEVDNIHSGGIVIGVSDDGFLMSEAFSEYGKRFSKHPDSNVIFKGYRISKVSEVIEAAKKLHMKVPSIKMISWDLSIDHNGEIVLIEINTTDQSVWFPQMVNGKSIFGENTEDVIQTFLSKN